MYCLPEEIGSVCQGAQNPFVCTYMMMSWLYKELAEDNACRCLLFEPTDAATATNFEWKPA